MDGMVNWESSQTADGDRFSNNGNELDGSSIEGTKCYDIYLQKKKKKLKKKF